MANMMMEDAVLCEGQMNEITVGSIYDDDSPVDTQALKFGEAQKADPDIVVVSGWCSSQMFPKSKAELTSPSDDLVQYWLSRRNLCRLTVEKESHIVGV